MAATTPVEKIGGGHRERRDARKACLRRRVPDLHQPIWLFKWQRPQQHCVDDAKNGGVRPHPQRQRQNRYGAEPGNFCPPSQTLSEPLHERFPPTPPPPPPTVPHPSSPTLHTPLP